MTQPWATLIASGIKKTETRDWGTVYRGPLLIHAAQGFPREAQDLSLAAPFRGLLRAAGYPVTRTKPQRPRDLLPRGAILAVATLADCQPLSTLAAVRAAKTRWGRQEVALSLLAPGRVLWILTDVHPLPAPLPWRGALGIWPVSRAAQAQIAEWLEHTELADGQLPAPAAAD